MRKTRFKRTLIIAAVAIVRSDNPALPNPIPPNREANVNQIEDMVRWAIQLLGGLERWVAPNVH